MKLGKSGLPLELIFLSTHVWYDCMYCMKKAWGMLKQACEHKCAYG